MDILVNLGKDALAVTAIWVAWHLRGFIAMGFMLLTFLSVDRWYRSRADKILETIDLLDEDKGLDVLKLYRRKFFGLRLIGIIFLLTYSYVTAVIVYATAALVSLQSPLVFWCAFLLTAYLYSVKWVINIPFAYLEFRQIRQQNKIKETYFSIFS